MKQQTAVVKEKYGLLYDDRLNGRLVAPIGMTNEESFEIRAQESLQLNEHIKTILLYTDITTNNLWQAVVVCNKGNTLNLRSMVSSVGQQTIMGKRLSWNKWRGSPYYKYFSRDI